MFVLFIKKHTFNYFCKSNTPDKPAYEYTIKKRNFLPKKKKIISYINFFKFFLNHNIASINNKIHFYFYKTIIYMGLIKCR